jgi:hypothetical protein
MDDGATHQRNANKKMRNNGPQDRNDIGRMKKQTEINNEHKYMTDKIEPDKHGRPANPRETP